MNRNGKIDFLRFLFALFIMFLHFGYRPQISIGGLVLSLGNKGDFGVYFFFAVSGFLLSRSVEKLSSNSDVSAAEQEVKFISKRYKNYMKWYLPAFVLVLLLDLVQRGVFKAGLETLRSIPNLLLLGSLGLSSGTDSIGYYVGASWYLSALFISQLFLFPLIRFNYKRWCCCIAPVIMCVSLSLQVNGHGDRILRAILPMTIGTICYEIVKYMDKKEYCKLYTNLMRIIEVVIYAIVFVYMCSDMDGGIVWGLIFLVATGVMLSFSKHTEYSVFDKPFFEYLGRISFPLYLLHPQVLNWSEYIIETFKISVSDEVRYPILYVLSVAIAIIAYKISKKCNLIFSKD